MTTAEYENMVSDAKEIAKQNRTKYDEMNEWIDFLKEILPVNSSFRKYLVALTVQIEKARTERNNK